MKTLVFALIAIAVVGGGAYFILRGNAAPLTAVNGGGVGGSDGGGGGAGGTIAGIGAGLGNLAPLVSSLADAFGRDETPPKGGK